MSTKTIQLNKSLDQQSVIGSEVKNPLPVTEESWIDVAGLSWIFVEKYPDYT